MPYYNIYHLKDYQMNIPEAPNLFLIPIYSKHLDSTEKTLKELPPIYDECDVTETINSHIQRINSYVKKKFPRIDWSTTRIVEPRPFVVNNKLYWMLSITPNDFAGITYTVFVNSENNEVIAFDDDEGVYSFVKQGIIKEITEDTEEKTKEELREEKISEIEKLLDEIKSLE